jgi:hypothetical protein
MYRNLDQAQKHKSRIQLQNCWHSPLRRKCRHKTCPMSSTSSFDANASRTFANEDATDTIIAIRLAENGSTTITSGSEVGAEVGNCPYSRSHEGENI